CEAHFAKKGESFPAAGAILVQNRISVAVLTTILAFFSASLDFTRSPWGRALMNSSNFVFNGTKRCFSFIMAFLPARHSRDDQSTVHTCASLVPSVGSFSTAARSVSIS